MKVMVIVKATKQSEAGELSSEELFAEMGRFNQQLIDAGILLAADGLQPSSQGARVRFEGQSRTVIDGPFAETKELVAGFWLWQVQSLGEAIEWVKRCPNPTGQTGEIEIRPVFEHCPEPESGAREALAAPRIEQGRELLIAGWNESYTQATSSGIARQWGRIAPRLGQIPGQVGQTAYGVCWNFQPGCGAFEYLAGVEVNDAAPLPREFTRVRIPAGQYAVFLHQGHVSAIRETWSAIGNSWLPRSGHQAAETPAFERYGEAFDPRTGLGPVEIWVPLKA